MKIIAGLGNPGQKYEYTRHNVGFLALEFFVQKKLGYNTKWLQEKKFNAVICNASNIGCVFVKPQTYMNASGESLSKIMNYYNIEPAPQNLLIVHDEVDLKFGEVKCKAGSSTAGHHGVGDIADQLKTINFTRLRIGVGRPENKQFDVGDYVLSKFSEEELPILNNLLEQKVYNEIEKFIETVS